MQNENKITIRFEFTDEFGGNYSQESKFEVFSDLGEKAIDCIGEKFNVFLKQIGYIRHNDFIFMEDVTEEELWALQDFLDDLRSDTKSGGDDNG